MPSHILLELKIRKKGGILIARYSIYISEDLEKKLDQYMKENKFKKKSVAIKDCICRAILNDESRDLIYEISQKLNRILYRQNINKKLLEQIYVNFGFPINENIDSNNLLKEFYHDHNQYAGKFD